MRSRQRLADQTNRGRRETFVRGMSDTPKSEKSERTIAIGERLASELFAPTTSVRSTIAGTRASRTRRRAGIEPTKLTALAGHSDFATPRG